MTNRLNAYKIHILKWHKRCRIGGFREPLSECYTDAIDKERAGNVIALKLTKKGRRIRCRMLSNGMDNVQNGGKYTAEMQDVKILIIDYSTDRNNCL